MYKIKKYKAAAFVSLIILSLGCQKTIKGYLSDDIYYQVNPFEVQQGVTTVSSSLILNGSTAPLNVQLAALRDSAGNDADSILRTPRSIVTYKSALSYEDTTLDMLNAKLNDSLVRPFNIATIGGRLQFTAATSYVPIGSYNIDLIVTNSRGEKFIKDACTIVIKPLEETYTTGYFSYRYYTDAKETDLFRTESDVTYSNFDISYDGKSGKNQIIFKWVDKNGVPFNPNKGEVKDHSSISAATTSFPTIHQWAPYYSSINTDSTIIQKLPDVNLSFPYFSLGMYPSSGGVRIDNNIYGVKNHSYVWTVMYFSLLAPGTYYITYHLLNDVHQ